MTTPGSDRNRPPQRSLADQAMTTGMDLLGRIDPKLLKSAGMFLMKAQLSRRTKGVDATKRDAGTGFDIGAMAGQLGDLLREVATMREGTPTAHPTPARSGAATEPAIGTAPAGSALIGVPAVAGTARGTARVIAGTDLPAGLGAGDVVVCRTVPNTWTPLLADVTGIVFETGGAGSVAMRSIRSHGIPTVRLDGATARITDGQPLTLDGGSGRVTPREP